MGGTSASTQVTLEGLAAALKALESRVAALEGRPGEEPGTGLSLSGTGETACPTPEPTAPQVASVVPLIGKALLGLSLAYLLRALSEMHVWPVAAGVAAGVLYALGWLVLAARAPAAERLRAGVLALTSVSIVVPLLWEATVRFRAAPPWAAAGVLLCFSIFGLGISWRRNVGVVAWITTLAGVLTACALLIATRDLLPFTLALLAIAAAVEVSACLEHWLPERWLVAIVADLSILLLTYIVTRPGGIPEGYAPISPRAAIALQIALLLIYLGSTIVRTLHRGFTFTGFEIVQCVAAFLISISGALSVAHATAAVVAVAAFCLACGAACYVVSFAFLERRAGSNINFQTYATFGLLLVLVGSRFVLGAGGLALFWCVLALAFVTGAAQARRITLKWHGAVYVIAAGIVSGVTVMGARVFLNSDLTATRPLPDWIAWTTAAAAVVAYALGSRKRVVPPEWHRRVLYAVLAIAAAWNAAAAAGGLAEATCTTSFCPTVLTGILTLFATALAWAAAHRRRPELAWAMYVLIATATYKLLVQDLRQTHALAIVVSLLLYGGVLVLVPRLARAEKAQA